MAQDTDEDRIRVKAHEIWESEGHPHGRDADHWAQAREIIAIQDGLSDTLLPRNTGAEEPIEPTQAVEPYGDVPNLTDQGEHDLTSIDREPEVTKPSHAVYTTGESIGHVARPKPSDVPGKRRPRDRDAASESGCRDTDAPAIRRSGHQPHVPPKPLLRRKRLPFRKPQAQPQSPSRPRSLVPKMHQPPATPL